MHTEYMIYMRQAGKYLTTIYGMKQLSREKKFISGSHPPFAALALSTGTTTVTSSVTASPKTVVQDCAAAED